MAKVYRTMHAMMPATVWRSATIAARIWLTRQILHSGVYSCVPTHTVTRCQFASCCNVRLYKTASAARPSLTLVVNTAS